MKLYNFKKGDLFFLPSMENLIELGWKNNKHMTYSMKHPDSPVSIAPYMFGKLGTLVTIDCNDTINEGCYFITKVTFNYPWPIDLLSKQMLNYFTSDGCSCEEGMTPIGGYFICKYCGKNMKKIHN